MWLLCFLFWLIGSQEICPAGSFTDRDNHDTITSTRQQLPPPPSGAPPDAAAPNSRLARMRTEGDECQMNAYTRSPGVCTQVTECAPALQQITAIGRSTFPRCGFTNHTEVVCCPKLPAPKVKGCDEAGGGFQTVAFGGEEVVKYEFPYMVALGYKTNRGTEFSCAGTLVTARHAVTAAHCVHNRHNRVPIVAQLGALDVANPEDTVQKFAIQDIVWHPQHKKSRQYYDIAVLRLNGSISFTPQVTPVALPELEDLLELRTQPRNFTVAGWGVRDIDAPLSDKLIKVEILSLEPKAACEKHYTDIATLPDGLTDYMICMTDRNSSRKAETCPGDSGGPLLMENRHGRVFVGVTSFGQGCGGSVPGVYTAVPAFIEWIKKVICQL